MPDTPENYTISTDFPGGAVNMTKLQAEILASSITTVLNRIDVNGDAIAIVFNAALTAGEGTTLDGDVTGPAGGLIAAHDNIAQSVPPVSKTTDPLPTDDSSEGYFVGARWVNTASSSAFSCMDATVGAAIWKEDSNSGQSAQVAQEAPGEHFFGSLMGYPTSGGSTVSEIQYSRVWLTAGLVIDRVRLFQEAGGNAARNFRGGIYDQATPTSETGVPVSRVAQTASTASAPGNDASFVTTSLSAAYTVTTTGYYWIALMADSASLKFATSSSHRANYLPVRRESGTGVVLPATAGALTNPRSAVIYAAILDQ